MSFASRPPSRAPKWVFVLSGCLGFCCLGGVVLGFWGWGSLKSAVGANDLPAAVEAYKKTGLPWLARDLDPQPPVKDSENAAIGLRSAFQLLGDDLDSTSHALQKEARARNVSDFQKSVRPLEKGLGVAVNAIRKPRLDWRPDWDLGPNLKTTELTASKALSRVLVSRALIEATDDKWSLALADLRSARRLAWLTSTEPSLIPLLARCAMEKQVLDSVRRCCAYWHSDVSSLESLDKLLREPLPAPSFVGALRGDAFLSVALCRNLDFYGVKAFGPENENIPEIDPNEVKRDGLPSNPIYQGNMATVLRVWTDIAPGMEEYPKDPVKLRNFMLEVQKKDLKNVTIGNALAQGQFSYDIAVTALQTLQTDKLVTQALVEALLIRDRTGRYPESFNEIPGDWKDPITRRTLHLTVEGKKIRIYGAGPDREVHEGLAYAEASDEERKKQAYDIVAAYPLPADR